MPSDRPSRIPGGLNAQLVTAIIVALGIGGGGGSLLAGGGGQSDHRLEDHEKSATERFATKLELTEQLGQMRTDLSLIRQELAQVSDQLVQVSAQLVEVEKQLQRPSPRRR